MSLISFSNISDGSTIDASDVNNPLNTIYNDYNGNITSSNLATNAVTTTKITDANVTPVKWTNPYKFRVRRVAAQNTTAGSFSKINFDTEDFDTNNNFDSTTNFRYTAPVSGYYQFNSAASAGSNPGVMIQTLYKNGSIYQRGTHLDPQTGFAGGTYADMVFLTAGDYVEIWNFSNNVVPYEVSAGSQPYFSGYLVSQT